MSATRDKSQKVAFVYSNLYQLYKKEKAQKSVPPQRHSNIIRTGEVKRVSEGLRPGLKIHAYQPIELKSSKKEPVVSHGNSRSTTVEGLKKNLERLQALQSRLQFMLVDLEEYLKKSSN